MQRRLELPASFQVAFVPQPNATRSYVAARVAATFADRLCAQRRIAVLQSVEDRMDSLPTRYRPRTFEEVVGQEVPVRYISGLISKGPVLRDILLHGSIGSGKTSLARIYAKALNCAAPTPSGSPCLVCDSCESIEVGDESRYAELDTPQFNKPAELKDRVNRLLAGRQKSGGRLVVFIDEAHALSNYRDSFDFLLKLVEDTPEGVSFCFATTAFARISAALRSRLVLLRVRPLSMERSVEYLSDIARRESIEVESEALTLIAGLGEGQPRNMLQALGQVSEGSGRARVKVTREGVIEMFGVSETEPLYRYFVALGNGHFALQIKLFFDWHEPVKVKAKLMQLFLFSLYYNEICGARVSIDPLIESIRASDREQVLDAFRTRLGAENLKHFWEDMLAAWPSATSAMSDEGLMAIVTTFQRVANRSAAVPRAVALANRVPDAPAERVQARRNRSRSATPSLSRMPKIERDPKHLTIDNVGSLINSSSFLVQEYGVQFNAKITIRHANFGCKTQAEASDHFARFSTALNSRLLEWAGAGHRLCVQEVNEREGFRGRVVAVIPDAHRLSRWTTMWDRRKRLAGQEEAAITFEILPREEGLQSHWRCVRWICGGLNPNEPLAERLKIEPAYQRIAGDIGTRTRLSVSDSIKATEVKKTEEAYGLGVLSAFDDGEWERLYDGWEQEEHLSRMKHGRIRQEAVEEVRLRFQADDSPEARARMEAELAELRESWPGKEDRERSWPYWGTKQ